MAEIEVARIENVAALLGGRRVLRASASGTSTMREIVQRGLPYEALETFVSALHLQDEEEVAAIAGMAVRTLARRKVGRVLRPDESDRLYRAARVVARAIEVLGSREKAERWMKKSNPALGGEIPLSLLDTDLGVQQILGTLGRIEYGLVS